MIVPMKKVSLVILSREKEEAVKRLRDAGLVHLEKIEGKGERLSELKGISSRLYSASSVLGELKASKTAKQQSLSNSDTLKKADAVIALAERKKTLLEQVSAWSLELDRLAPWGEVNVGDFAFLAGKGINISLYEVPADKYDLLGDDAQTILVNSTKTTKRFVLVSGNSEEAPTLIPEAYQVALPAKSTNEISSDIAAAKSEISRIDGELAENCAYIKAFEKYDAIVKKDIEFENVCSGMEGEEGEEKEALSWLTGYVPSEDIGKIKSVCSSNHWAMVADEPSDDDGVPTKLKNSKLVSLIYPLTDFLDVTPGYKEFDISSWFLLFFCIFFSMIFADAGYGALIAIVGLLLLKAKKNVVGSLVTLLGVCTMVWGFLTCSWFGIDSSMLPPAFVNMSSALFSQPKLIANGMEEAAAKSLADKNQQIFCFALALIQLSIAHIRCCAANRKSLKGVGDFGALLQLWGTFYVVLSMVVADGVNYSFPLSDNGEPVNLFGLVAPHYFPTIAIAVLLFGFLLNFIFANYEGSVVNSILESLKNIISVLLGIVNVFSDIVSYIRLWAVALAGAAISSTVNQMAGPMFGKLAIFVFAIILLVFGHGLNMILNLLSVIVHGVRLNTLEFSQHLGMTWSGIKYKPFSN